MTENRCDYCWRPAVSVLLLKRGLLRMLMRRRRRQVRVCRNHLMARHG